jgi:hypothetical protein
LVVGEVGDPLGLGLGLDDPVGLGLGLVLVVALCVGDGLAEAELESVGLADELELGEAESDWLGLADVLGLADELSLADALALAEELSLADVLAEADELAEVDLLAPPDLLGEADTLALDRWLAAGLLLKPTIAAVSSALFGSVEQAALTIGWFAAGMANAWPARLKLRNAKPVIAPSAAGLKIRALTGATSLH